ncbi:MAG: ParB/RepB/Spo0J family partition protein [Nitriliruptoraceae bacterium]
MSRRTGLGRGLAALIPPAPGQDAAEAPTEVEHLPDATAADATRTADAEASSGHAPDQPGEEAAPSSDSRQATEAPEPSPALDGPDDTPPVGSGLPGDQPASYAELDPQRITPNPRQPREIFDPDELDGLATSLADVGMLQPLVVRPLGDGGYELIAGERRLRAALLAGLARVPALVRHTEDADLLKEALVENIHRVQLNPLEEAAAYQQLLEEFGVSQEELATRLGRSRPAISNAIRLLQLPDAVQRRVAAGVLSAGHAKALLALPDGPAQSSVAERIVAEGLSVRATEELVRLRLVDAPTPQPKPRRTATAPGLVELQEDLSDALKARVRITMGARKGRLAVEFTSVDDLERIVAVIADGLGAQAPSSHLDHPDSAADPDAGEV